MNSHAADAHRPASESGRAMRTALEARLAGPQEPDAGPPSIPDHDLLARIGFGAYGDVWIARSALGTLRAVKIVYRDRFEDDRPYQREFHGILKYEPISRTHKGLIAILHVGRNDAAGCFYYVMELADTADSPPADNSTPKATSETPSESDSRNYRPRTLRSELVKRRRLPTAEAAQVALRLAEALTHLHQNGLVHRDVKPSNVIFVGGQPKLADIGLITTLGDSRSFVGTEGFIPPEGPGTPQADMYALGKLLYEMATGADRLEFPRLPPDLTGSTEGDGLLELNEIITRACAPELDQRYATATELVADLNLFLSGRSLRQARRLERHVFWLKRFAVVASLVVLLVAVAFAWAKTRERQATQRERLSQERARIESSLRRRAEAAEQKSREQLYTALLEQSRATVRSGEMGQRVRALEAVQHAAAISNSCELRTVAWTALALPDLRFEREITGGPGLTAFELDPAFERIAVCRGASDIEILSISDRRVLAKLPASTNAPSFVIHWSADGKYLAVKRDVVGFGDRADLEVWEVANATRRLLVPGATYGAFAFDRQRSRILTSMSDGSVVLWDLTSGRELQRSKLVGTPAYMSLSPTADRFAAVCEVNDAWTISIHRLSDGAQILSYPAPDRPSCVDWHPERDLILTSDHGGWVRLIDPHTGQVRTLGRHKAQSAFAAFTPDGEYALTGGWERELICWSLHSLEKAFTIDLNNFVAQFSADGRKWAVVTESGLRMYAFEKPEGHRELDEDLGGRVRRASFSSDNRWLAVPGQERLGVWDLITGGPGALLEKPAGARLFFSPEGRELFASLDDQCYRYQLSPATNPTTPPIVRRLELTQPPGFTSLAVISNRIIFTTTKGSLVGRFSGAGLTNVHAAPTSSGVSGTSPDGRWLAIFEPYADLLHVYHLPGLEPATVLTNRGSIGEFAFSPDGEELVIASRTRLDFWRTSDWQQTRFVPRFMGILYTAREGPWWLSSDFQHGGLYEAASLKPLLPLPSGVMPIALSPDEKLLAVSVDSRRVQVWNLAQIRAQFRMLGIDWD